jgi:hypothetical protein
LPQKKNKIELNKNEYIILILRMSSTVVNTQTNTQSNMDSKKKKYPKVVRDSYSDGSVSGDLKHGAKVKSHNVRLIAGVAKKMRQQRDIKDYNIQQLKLTAEPLLKYMIEHNYNNREAHPDIYKYLNRSFTAVWSLTEFMCGSKCIVAERPRKSGKKKGAFYTYWGRPDKEDKDGYPVYVCSKKDNNAPYFKKRYLCKDLKIGLNKYCKNIEFKQQLTGNNVILQYFQY